MLRGELEHNISGAKKRYLLVSAEIADMTTKLAEAKGRLQALKTGQTDVRHLSRRITRSTDLRKEAIEEISSYIFTLELKLKQHRDLLELLMGILKKAGIPIEPQ
jgi:division protein CdvB (Snf7/Vps24/ESCRT-III family)